MKPTKPGEIRTRINHNVSRYVNPKIVLLIVISILPLLSITFASQTSRTSLASRGFIRYPTQDTSGAVFGWGGYIISTSDVIPILDNLQAGGYTAIRYWARPYWYYGASSHNLKFSVLDLLVNEAAKRGIIVYIDPEHNYPPSSFIQGREQDWINDLSLVGQRYNDRTNVVLECVNEYTGDDQPALYNRGIAALRANGIHLPLLFNFWWNQKNVALIDPDNNYAIGRHFYGSIYEGYNPATPINLAYAVTQSGIANTMYRYFDDTSQTLYFASVKKLKIPNGWVITELGPTDNEALVSDPGVGSMAYAMQFLRESAAHNVSVINYRIGEASKKAVYEQKALEYFQEPFFVPP